MRLLEQLATIGPFRCPSTCSTQMASVYSSPKYRPRSSITASRSASGSWQKPTRRSFSRTLASTPARFSAVGSGVWANWPLGSLAQDRHLAAQFFQQPAAQDAAGPVVRSPRARETAAGESARARSCSRTAARWSAWCVAGAARRRRLVQRRPRAVPARACALSAAIAFRNPWPVAAGMTRPSAENSFSPL